MVVQLENDGVGSDEDADFEIRSNGGTVVFRVDDTDGVRVTTPDGWWLIRASNTQSALVVRCEAGDAAALSRLKAEIREQMSLSGVAPPDF